MKRLNLTGKKFGRWLVLRPAKTDKNGHLLWRCQCECGTIKEINGQSLRRGATKSCGCYRDDKRRLRLGEAGFNSLFTKYKNRAKKMGRSFRLTKNRFLELTSGDCFYCGISPKRKTRLDSGMYGSYKYNGIDRLDSRYGYSRKNTVSCCWECNMAKGRLDAVVFIEMAKRITKHRRFRHA
jgi:hypothetical protein